MRIDDLEIGELARMADVSTRTIRYYVEQGLLPSPGSRGRSAKYGRGHLDRIQLIKRLQAEHLPLAEIRQRLETLTDWQVAELLEMPEPRPPASALDYVRDVLGSKDRYTTMHISPKAPHPHARPSLSESRSNITAPGYDRSRWDRVQIGPDIEIHIRRPLSREQHRRVDELIEFARKLLDEEAV